MKVFLLPLFMFIFFVTQSVAAELIPQSFWLGSLYYIPHWTLIFAILIITFYDREHSYVGLLNGLAFAFLTDLVYTNLLGVYFLAYGLALYMVHVLKRYLHKNFLVVLVFSILGLAAAEVLIYSLYFIIGQVDLSFNAYIFNRLIPTLLINILFLLIIYPIFIKKLVKWKYELEK
ncbi:rod shape-determining protein MreD [Alkalibacillus haloalkaliphilus]|uniref:rod shape-determining protein MreD n=1 Tax=Alkalibacillus haloalkaliphilus TaxID=94136 RepID=UPI002935C8C7|nr:rod shape-determining protein MreD [Alkalibacillus haloalkaliphilus]MDV2581122.1 rod shape-determining protein MreD [Alkalibacillus haloalkaliphilus]